MSELLTKVLGEKLPVEEIVSWVLTGDVTNPINGVDQIEFSSFLLDFLRKHTRSLLSANDVSVNETSDSKISTAAIKTSNLDQSINLSLDSTSLLNKSILGPSEAKVTTNFHESPFRSKSPYNNIPGRNPNTSSIDLLEKRLTSKENGFRTPTKFVDLTDFLTKEKPDKQRKKKKRIQPLPCSSNEQKGNVEMVPVPKDRVGSMVPVPKDRVGSQLTNYVTSVSYKNDGQIRRVKPISEYEWQNFPKGHSTPVKLLQRVNLRDNTTQSNTNSPGNKTEGNSSMLITSQNEDQQFKIMPAQLMKRIEPTSIMNSSRCSNYEKSVDNLKPDIEITVEDISSIKPKHKQLILNLSKLYSAVLTSNFSRDLLKEINYIMSLLLPSESSKCCQVACICFPELIQNGVFVFSDNICLFKTNAEGIYFAASVLKQEWNLLKYLNKSTLTILTSKTSLTAVAPEFVDQIKEYIELRTSSNQDINIVGNEMWNETVKFNMDNDCRPNYLNDQLFCAFKKQRDVFYSLLQDWEESGQQQNSAAFFKARLKILRSIFSFSNASSNMYRIADLFVSQILASVFNENFKNYETLNISGISMNKFYLLNRRFFTPCSILVGNEIRFPGVQEFFKDFLRSCECPAFLSHVKDILVHRIILHNKTKFSVETSAASVRQEGFLVCINKLCLLAKFLSLITFLPYKDKETLPPHFRIPLVEARNYVLAPLDIDRCLTEAISSGRLLITVPWIVEFLNGIDETSIHLPCYRILFAKLQYLLYKIKLPTISNGTDENIFLMLNDDVAKSVINTENEKVGLKQLQRLSTQCEDEFAKKFVDEILRTADCFQILVTLYVNSLFNNVSTSTIIKVEEMSTLIDQPILISSEFYIGETALYQCCPQLIEIKSILEGGRKLSYKSVIPKAEKTFCDQKTKNIALELQLEMHFFENISSAVKRTVDIVAKQLSLNCERILRANLIPELKLKLCEALKMTLANNNKPEEIVMDIMLAKFYKIVREGVEKQLSILHDSIEFSLKGMLTPEITQDENIFDICCSITCRKSFEMIYNWILNYISFQSIFSQVQKLVEDESVRIKSVACSSLKEKKTKKSKKAEKKNNFDESMTMKNGSQEWTGLQPAPVLNLLRHWNRILIANSAVPMGLDNEEALHLKQISVTFDEIDNLLDKVIECVKHRPDLQFIAFRRILLSSLDLISILVFLWPVFVIDSLLEKFAILWEYGKNCKLHLPFEQVLCIRNVDILKQVTKEHQKPIFVALQKYLSFTLERKILRSSKVFRQVLKLLQFEWHDEELISNVIIHVRESLEKCSSSNIKILTAIESLIF